MKALALLLLVVTTAGWLGLASGAELRGRARLASAAALGVATGDEEGSGGGSGGGDGGGDGVRGPSKRPDWLQPVLPQTVAVPKEASPEKAIRLMQQMKKPWEGMEDPRLSETEEGAAQNMARHAKQNGEATVTGAGAYGNPADAPKPQGKKRAVVPLLPPVHAERTLLWNPEDVLAKRWTPVADDWDKKAEKKAVEGMAFHPLRLFSERVSPVWAADVRRMHNQRYRKKHEDLKKYIPPNMRLNPAFFPHVVARYTDRVPSSDLNANPVEWPVAKRFLGEQPHGPYDSYHENPDRYLPPLDLFSWREQKRARPNAIWPHKIEFPRMPARGDTWNQMVELDTRVTRRHADADADEATDEEQDETEEDMSFLEVDTAMDAEAEAEAEADAEVDAEADAEAEVEAEGEGEGANDGVMTPEQMYWYWVQPEVGRDRFGRDGRLFTPPHPGHRMHQFMDAADAATGHSSLHIAPGPKPKEIWMGKAANIEAGIAPVKTQVQAEPFDPSASLNVADLQSKLERNKENPAKAAEAMLTDDRMPYLFSDGKPDEADYKKAPRPSADGNQYDEEHNANLEKIKKLHTKSPWRMGAEGDLADHPNFPYASFRHSWLGEPRGLAVPMRPPSLKYQRVKAGTKEDFPKSYAAPKPPAPPATAAAAPKPAFLEVDDEVDAEDEDELEVDADDEDEDVADDEAEAVDAADDEADDADEAEAEDAVLLALGADDEAEESESHARAHIPKALHAKPPVYSYRAPPPPIRLDAHGNPLSRTAAAQRSAALYTAAVEVTAKATARAQAQAKAKAKAAAAAKTLSPAEMKPWWATKAGRARNAMSPEQRRLADRKHSDPAQVLDHPMFRSAYSAPVADDAQGESAADRPHGSAAALLDSLAALARNPLSDAANVVAHPKSAADRALADAGRDQAMRFAGIDEDAPRAAPGPDAEAMDAAEAPAAEFGSAAAGMRFRQTHARSHAKELEGLAAKPAKSESAATFAADPNSFARTLEDVESAAANSNAIGEGPNAGEDMRFAGAKFGPPPTPSNSKAGYGVGLRGMILSQDAAIIAGPNRYRSPTLVNPYSIAMARAQQPYGPAGPFVPNGGSPYANYPYNYPGGVPAPVPAPPAVPASATSAFGPRGVKAVGAAPTTVVNIYGASGAVSTSSSAGRPAAVAGPSPAYPYAVGAPGAAPLPYGDTFPPSTGPFPPPLSGLMDIAHSMHNRAGPGSSGHPPPALYGHPFQKVPVPQFPPSSPTGPYPRYPMGPVGALAESGWQKPRLIPIVYGGKA